LKNLFTGRISHAPTPVAACAVCPLFATAVLPAHACINDRELVPHEREFKSDYNSEPATGPSEPGGATGYLVGAVTASGLGGALLAGALALGLMRTTRRES
jgi:hypothetical protein